jgi:hypothetical protein
MILANIENGENEYALAGNAIHDLQSLENTIKRPLAGKTCSLLG